MGYVKHMRLGALLFFLVMFAFVDFMLVPWALSRPITDQYIAEKMAGLGGVFLGWVAGRQWSYGDDA